METDYVASLDLLNVPTILALLAMLQVFIEPFYNFSCQGNSFGIKL